MQTEISWAEGQAVELGEKRGDAPVRCPKDNWLRKASLWAHQPSRGCIEGEQEEKDSKEQSLGAAHLGGLEGVESQQTSQCSGAGCSEHICGAWQT